ncbi:MAG: hypothetical protein GY762_21685 [Proteobacteria bacterium]|nr:hypothetical protein [Pseudomonadota bacterium]
MKLSSLVVPCAGLLMWGLIIGCGGKPDVQRVDPYLLLTEGQYAEARAAIVKENAKDPMSRAIVAASLAAEDPSTQNGALAVQALTDGAEESAILSAATRALNLAFYIPQPVTTEVSLLISEVALGALGQGALASPSTTPLSLNDATRQVAVSVLERVKIALDEPGALFESNRILTIWNSCSALMNNVLVVTDDAQAWLLFHSLGGIAVVVQEAAPNSELSLLLLESTVIALESNPAIAIAARCDLSSPFDNLKMALAYKRNLAGRLEVATSGGLGCTRGTYAPEAR